MTRLLTHLVDTPIIIEIGLVTGNAVREKKESMVAKTKSLPEVVRGVYDLLEPLESEDRKKVVGSVMTLFGDETPAISKGEAQVGGEFDGAARFGSKAKRWMKQNEISEIAIEDVFHGEGNEVEVIASDIPGRGKRGKTHNCYLLTGIRLLLATDEATFSENEAVALCRNMGCHDRANHAKSRSELGNIVAGSKSSGFKLPAPGLRAAATLIKSMSTTN